MTIQFALLTLQWVGRRGTPVSRDKFPALGSVLTKDTRFTASGWRNNAENYLFLERTDAEALKRRIDEIHPAALKAKIQILDITVEEVAHLDLDPVERSRRHVAI